MPDLLLAVLGLTVLYGLTAGNRFGHLSVASLFIYAQATMAIGTLPALDPNVEADTTHASVILWSLASLVFVSCVCAFAASGARRSDYAPDVDFRVPTFGVTALIILSLAVSTWYYLSVGYIAFFESINALTSNTGEDIAALRLASYAGDQYFYPGYVNQFKNALLPALVVVALTSAYHARKPGRLVMAIAVVPITIVFLLGTGQRGAFVLAMALVLIFAYQISPRKFHKYVTSISLAGLALFFLTTFASGRVAQQLAQASDASSVIGVLFDQLAFRILGSNQISSIAGFRYIYGNEIPLGSEWTKAAVGVLPGQPGSDLSNKIFEVLYGSDRGTSPLSLWGSVYYNFGFTGVPVVAIIIALVLCRLTIAVNLKKSTNLLQVVGVSGVTVSVASWIADGPTTTLNTGIMVYIALWCYGLWTARSPRSAGITRTMAGTQVHTAIQRTKRPSQRTGAA